MRNVPKWSVLVFVLGACAPNEAEPLVRPAEPRIAEPRIAESRTGPPRIEPETPLCAIDTDCSAAEVCAVASSGALRCTSRAEIPSLETEPRPGGPLGQPPPPVGLLEGMGRFGVRR